MVLKQEDVSPSTRIHKSLYSTLTAIESDHSAYQQLHEQPHIRSKMYSRSQTGHTIRLRLIGSSTSTVQVLGGHVFARSCTRHIKAAPGQRWVQPLDEWQVMLNLPISSIPDHEPATQ